MHKVKFITYQQDNRIFTDCVIEDVVRASVVLHPKEQHCKAKGQKYALARAVSQLPRKERKQYWDEFFNRSKAVKRLINAG